MQLSKLSGDATWGFYDDATPWFSHGATWGFSDDATPGFSGDAISGFFGDTVVVPARSAGGPCRDDDHIDIKSHHGRVFFSCVGVGNC
ncbi:hypothetical protein QYE76_059320 [Lolium multiflorum]|uniref:Uncharacterized protein n=1 Tax=Lolium multiflorum TaxID=4521 RepID=A0AAD8QHL1_LOLMU|nr:hypothetical protein QYE76_059320 [Lolium multiflorum]